MLRLGYLTANHRRLPTFNALDEEVAGKAAVKAGIEVNEEMPEGELWGVKMQVFRPPTWAIFRCRLEVQSEVDSEHARRYVSGLNLHWEVDENYIEFGDKRVQYHVHLIAFLDVVDVVCLHDH